MCAPHVLCARPHSLATVQTTGPVGTGQPGPVAIRGARPVTALTSRCPHPPPGSLPVWDAVSSGCWGPTDLRPRPGGRSWLLSWCWGPRSVSSGQGALSGGALMRPRRPPGCPKGFYGKHCRKKCHCAHRGRCHRVYGACLCDPGLYGRFCHLGESVHPLQVARGRAPSHLQAARGQAPSRHAVPYAAVCLGAAVPVCRRGLGGSVRSPGWNVGSSPGLWTQSLVL